MRTQGIALSTDAHLLKTLERRNRELEVLIEIGKALTSTVELENVLTLIMDQVSRLLKTQAWSLLLRDEQSGDLTFEIAVSPSTEKQKLKGMRVAAGQGIAGWVAEHGTALVIPDVSADSRFSGSF